MRELQPVRKRYGGGREGAESGALNRCPVCERVAEHWYLCHRCKVFTTQSAAGARVRAFSLSSCGLGGPDPACPGCLSRTGPRIREHICDTLLDSGVEVILTTPRTSCPLCGEAITSVVGESEVADHPSENTHLTAGGATHSQNPARPSAGRSDRQEAHMLTGSRQWFAKHRQVLIIGLLVPLILSSLFYENCKGVLHDITDDPPVVTKIAAERLEVPEGTQLKIWAETLKQDNRPARYNWDPEDRIINNGQQYVILNTQTNERRTESYTLTVSVTPIGANGAKLQEPKPITVKVVPMKQWNNPPEFIRRIRSNPEKQELRAGESLTLEALATDDDRDKLYYDWYVENEAALVEDNGKSRVKIITPPDLARYSSVPLRVWLTVKDGRDGGAIQDNATFTIVPKPRGRPRGPGPPKYIVVQQKPAPPQGANANAAPSPASAAPLQQQPTKQPAGGGDPPQSNSQPTKPQQGREGAQDRSP